jgi:hypothetical protein
MRVTIVACRVAEVAWAGVAGAGNWVERKMAKFPWART